MLEVSWKTLNTRGTVATIPTLIRCENGFRRIANKGPWEYSVERLSMRELISSVRG